MNAIVLRTQGDWKEVLELVVREDSHPPWARFAKGQKTIVIRHSFGDEEHQSGQVLPPISPKELLEFGEICQRLGKELGGSDVE